MLARCQSLFEACHRGSLGTHARRNFCLRQPSLAPSFQQGVEKFALFALDAFHFGQNPRPLQ